MIARIRKLLNDLGDAFWLIPAAMVFAGVIGAYGLVAVERNDMLPGWLLDGAWIYTGGPTGAWTLLGAVASSTIAVAGTVFSITIAALSLAAGQMGPRLLHNFIRDRGNQLTLGAFLGTFAYALMVLRTVRTASEGEFVPHLALTVAIVLALVCVATLVWFVGHMAGRINVDTVIDLVSEDVKRSLANFAADTRQADPPDPLFWYDAEPVADPRCGYLQQLNEEDLADWAAENATSIRLLVRPGDYVFPNAPIALLKPHRDGAAQAIRNATALGSQRKGAVDLDYRVGHLVEVAVRALSSGVNDPQTALSVLDRLGSTLCAISALRLRSGVCVREGRIVLVVPMATYSQLIAAMFQLIRQNGAAVPVVLEKVLDVLRVAAACERDPSRLRVMLGHADLVLADAERCVATPSDLDGVRRAHARFTKVLKEGPAGLASAD